jgi:hypothetical protein
MGFFAVEDKAGRERAAQFAEAGQGVLFAGVAADFEDAVCGDADFDLVACFEGEGIDDGGGQADG